MTTKQLLQQVQPAAVDKPDLPAHYRVVVEFDSHMPINVVRWTFQTSALSTIHNLSVKSIIREEQ